MLATQIVNDLKLKKKLKKVTRCASSNQNLKKNREKKRRKVLQLERT